KRVIVASITRRTFLGIASSFALAPTLGSRGYAVPGDTKVTLLGTRGGPRVVKQGPANPSNLVTAAGRSYVVDCGYGVTRQLVDAAIEAHEVRTTLITHNPPDHMLELGPLVYNAWAGGLREPIDVWGPPPLNRMIASFLDYIAYDIDIRMEGEGRPDLRNLIRIRGVDAPPPGLEPARLTVTAD